MTPTSTTTTDTTNKTTTTTIVIPASAFYTSKPKKCYIQQYRIYTAPHTIEGRFPFEPGSAKSRQAVNNTKKTKQD